MSKTDRNISLTRKQLQQDLKLAIGTYTITTIKNNLRIRLEINPADTRTMDDTFYLIGKKRPNQIIYQQVKTIKDDTIEGDGCLEIIFFDLIPDIEYALKIDPGKDGESYYAFQEIPWTKLQPLLCF